MSSLLISGLLLQSLVGTAFAQGGRSTHNSSNRQDAADDRRVLPGTDLAPVNKNHLGYLEVKSEIQAVHSALFGPDSDSVPGVYSIEAPILEGVSEGQQYLGFSSEGETFVLDIAVVDGVDQQQLDHFLSPEEQSAIQALGLQASLVLGSAYGFNTGLTKNLSMVGVNFAQDGQIYNLALVSDDLTETLASADIKLKDFAIAKQLSQGLTVVFDFSQGGCLCKVYEGPNGCLVGFCECTLDPESDDDGFDKCFKAILQSYYACLQTALDDLRTKQARCLAIFTAAMATGCVAAIAGGPWAAFACIAVAMTLHVLCQAEAEKAYQNAIKRCASARDANLQRLINDKCEFEAGLGGLPSANCTEYTF